MRALVAFKLVAYKTVSVADQNLVSSISRLVNAKDFFKENIFFKCKHVRINDCSFKYVSVVCCLKIRFYCLTFSAISNLNSADFATPNRSSEILILKIEMLLEFQNKRNGEIIWF